MFKDVRIDYDTPWNKIHWKSLIAAYAASPFFEFFMDDLAKFYEQRFEFLLDLNHQLLDTCLKGLGLNIPIRLTNGFLDLTGDDDPRHFIHPKLHPGKTDPGFIPHAYHQVFEEKHGFRPNLSILDLIFNEGPGSLSVLLRSLTI